jgi:hypothetical protein
MSETATHIYLADIATGVVKQVTTTPVLATLVSNFDFTSDGKQIAAVLVPDSRPAMPPAEPRFRRARKSKSRSAAAAACAPSRA